ncbi:MULTISPECIES: oligosaccharide flippase family protein [unclassified Rhodococcus (in: high G+C Gram-positive bacteria)]|uniref:oligosaccharide flippase family protein n=1 Tax=unclassified Rhodococcus (in: high G+C Gram-positive bacteria) TaxID=192944 RepID=UPI00117BD500|nr:MULTISPECIES: oligosaccharide flippase family protein [unclassified Rhodococcus (in: high G+C Gram-positive bacteria)]
MEPVAPATTPGPLVGRLMKGGLPAIAASAFVAFVPIIGSAYLSVEEYAVWALAATLSTIFIVFDFGTPTLATKLAGANKLDFRTALTLCVLSAIPPIVLGCVAIAVWPHYAHAANLVTDDSSATHLILLVSVGGVFRSIGIVYGAAALGRSHFMRRTAILFLGGSIQLIATIASLESGFGIVSLGIGIISAGFLQFVIGFALEGQPSRNDPRLRRDESVSVKNTIILFMKTRLLVATLGLFITQLDRWGLGLIGNPSLLAKYDIATRFIMIPKIIIIALAAGLVADSSRLNDKSQGRLLLFRVQKLVIFATVPLLAAASVVAFLAQETAIGAVPSLLVVTLVAVAHGSNCLTIAPVNILSGIGRPDFELRYLLPLACVVAISYGVGIISGNGMVQISIWAGAMVISSIWFSVVSNKYINEVLS